MSSIIWAIFGQIYINFFYLDSKVIFDMKRWYSILLKFVCLYCLKCWAWIFIYHSLSICISFYILFMRWMSLFLYNYLETFWISWLDLSIFYTIKQKIEDLLLAINMLMCNQTTIVVYLVALGFGEVMGSILGPSLPTAAMSVARHWVEGVPWPKTGETHYHAQLRLLDKYHAIKGLSVCNR